MKKFREWLQQYRKQLRWTLLVIAVLLFWFSLPDPLFRKPYSIVLTDRSGKLLQAKIADDGQWRFPANEQIPEKFREALITFEDKRFNYHLGVDPFALSRALWLNVKHQQVKSGGSTITMQVIRLSRNKPRNLWQKAIELILSVRLELSCSKEKILALYANHAPFGGNVVGIDAAAWRYFGRSAADLSWGEAAGLAILPNNPSMVRPDKNRRVMLDKRNRLLDDMLKQGIFDEQTCNLAKLEPIPDKPIPLPEEAPHLLLSLQQHKLGLQALAGISTTIDGNLQHKVNQVLLKHHQTFSANGINNAAALIIEVESGNVLAYAGNVYRPDKPDFDSYVDVIPAPRSPGSTLKPLLYAAMQQDGLLLPNTLVADIPTQVAGYSPQNFDLGYDGAVPASKALARSLNVPAVRMLQQYRIERFYELLKKLGVTTLTQPSGHYGLSLILGGGENSMWELGGVYAGLARTLNHYAAYNGRYDQQDIHPPRIYAIADSKPDWTTLPEEGIIGAGALYKTFMAMNEVVRPGDELLWNQFLSAQNIAWKTGTSFGFRDGWALGVTPKHVIVVWVGNADGEGRPGLTGIQTAAPVMFELFKNLPQAYWFDIPYDDLRDVKVCAKSGFLATAICEETDSILVSPKGEHSGPCPYHQLVHLDAKKMWRVTSDCEPVSLMQHVSWFVLPPSMEWYYKNHDHTYRTLPPWRKDCLAYANQSGSMEMIYPKRSNSIYVPVELDGKTGKCVFEVAHRNKSATIYWHLDGEYIGSTQEFHQMALNPAAGKHTLSLVDEEGIRLEQFFEIIKR